MAEDVSAAIARAYTGNVSQYAEVNADRSFAEPLLDAFEAELAPNAIVADLGCGPGWETAALRRRGFCPLGLDVTHDFLAHASREHPASGYLVGAFLALPFRARSLDGVWACSSLVHVPKSSIDTALREVARVLRPGGAFFASMQAGSTEGALASRTFPGKTFHYAYYEPEEWRAHLEGAGFELRSLNYHASAPEHRNPGAHGWIETLAMRSGGADDTA